MATYQTPGAYIEELPQLPPSIQPVESAVPAFIGYTEKAWDQAADDLLLKPKLIGSLPEYERYFGKADAEKSLVVTFLPANGANTGLNMRSDPATRSKFVLYYSLQLYFANGGGACYIVAVGNYETTGEVVSADLLMTGLAEAGKVEGVTLLCIPDALQLPDAVSYYTVMGAAITQAHQLGDRFVVMDLYPAAGNWRGDRQLLHDHLAVPAGSLRYAAVYWPQLVTEISFQYKIQGTDEDDDSLVKVEGNPQGNTLSALKEGSPSQYAQAKAAINGLAMWLPAAPAVVAVYVQTDGTQGVWKAPVNVNLSRVIGPAWRVTAQDQDDMNVDAADGLSINVIRYFAGKGNAIVWGARTLAGNDNEWRYVPVRRFFIMVEQSVKKGMEQLVFEPNDAATWVRVRAMVENFLVSLWRSGALQGAKPEQAFFVKVGLNQTMTAQDILEGRLIVEIGLAVVRPAEFIILRLTQLMQAE